MLRSGLTTGRHVVAGRPVRSWSAGTVGALPEVVLVPGLGAPGYLLPWARATSAWTRASVLDLPGWRWGRARACPPTLAGVAGAAADWIRATAPAPVVLVGHSTGSQAVIRTAAACPELVAALVLVGPTFAPAARSRSGLLRAAATTIAHERPGELPAVAGSYAHSGVLPLLRFLRDGLADRPELTLPTVRVPVLVLTGVHDGFAPPAWAATLADAAGAPHVRFPGAHNFPFPHPQIADAVLRQAVSRWQREGR